jgi:outer membrane protein OmpA-like peptidoglycan-associated protein
MIKTWQYSLFILIVFLGITSCAHYEDKTHLKHNQGVSFDEAIKLTATQLFSGIKRNRGLVGKYLDVQVVVDPFKDKHTQEVVVASSRITQGLIQQSATVEYARLKVLSQQSLPTSLYAISGYLFADKTQQGKYRIQAVARYIPSGKVVASSDVLINSKDLNYQRVQEYRDAPVLPIRKHQERLSTQLMQGYMANLYAHLETSAILNDAGEAYTKRNYQQAKSLFTLASQRADGTQSRTYAGLYISQLRLGDVKSAEAAFDKLIRINMQQDNGFALKILFAVNSTQFAGNAFAHKQYELWIRKIAEWVDKDKQCLTVIGHSSKTGSATYNQQLSLDRAKSIKSKMAEYFPIAQRKTKTLGKGFTENLVGSGSDDDRDMIDRRVEFLKGC